MDEAALVRRLLSHPSRFTTGALARDADGRSVSPTDPRAVCWCLVGAIRRAVPGWRPGTTVYRRVREITGELNLSAWSDRVGYAAVMAALDRADGKAEADESGESRSRT